MVKAGSRIRWTTAFRLFLAGWRRKTNQWDGLRLPPSFEVFPEARRVLTKFGGLRFGGSNEYICLEASAGEEVVDQIRKCEAKIGRRLYPVGFREHQDREYFLVDEDGTAYLIAGGALYIVASSFERALDHIVWGWKAPLVKSVEIAE